jgi:hypothetical protein
LRNKLCATWQNNNPWLLPLQLYNVPLAVAGITSSNAQPPPSVRVIKEFSQEEAQAGIDSAHAAILKGLSKLRWRHTMLNCFLILLPVTAAVALVCWPALREIQLGI